MQLTDEPDASDGTTTTG